MIDKREQAARQNQLIRQHIAHETEIGRQIQEAQKPREKQQEQAQERSSAVVIGLSTTKRGKEVEEPHQEPGMER